MSDASSQKILLVDDEPNVLSSLKRTFRQFSFEVLTANDGSQAIEILEKTKVDVIISDMRMPGMSGSTLLKYCAEEWPSTMRILLTGQADMDAVMKSVNSGHIFGYYQKPWDDQELCLCVKNALSTKALKDERKYLINQLEARNKELSEINNSLDTEVKKRTKALRQALFEIKKSNSELRLSYTETVRALSKLIDERDKTTTGHAKRVAENSKDIAIKLGLAPKELQDVVFAALLVQVAKLVLPEELLRLKTNELYGQEKKQYNTITFNVADILSEIHPLTRAANIIKYQYESFDGSGQPEGLAGEQIPIGSRIISIVRDYDLMQAGRFAIRHMDTVEAQQYLKKNKKRKYDPEIVDLFLSLIGEINRTTKYRTVVTAHPDDLVPGMEIVSVEHKGATILRDVILTQSLIDEIHDLLVDSDEHLDIKVRTRK